MSRSQARRGWWGTMPPFSLQRYTVMGMVSAASLLPILAVGDRGIPITTVLGLTVAGIISWRRRVEPGLVGALAGALSVLVLSVALPNMPIPIRVLAGVQVAVFALIGMSIRALTVRVRRSQWTLERKRKVVNAIRVHLDDGVCILDAAGQLSSINPAAERMLGWSADEVRGQDVRALLAPEEPAGYQDEVRQPEGTRPRVRFQATDRAQEWDRLDRALQAQEPTVVEGAFFRRKDGLPLPVTYTATPVVVEGQVTDVVLTFQDIAAGARPNAQQVGDDFYRTLVEISPDSTILADVYGYVVAANRRAAELHGYEGPEQMAGMRVLALLSQTSHDQVREDTRKALEEGGVRGAEYVAIRKNGTNFPVEVNTSLISEDDGKPKALMITERDITRHKVAEQMLRSSQEHVSLQHAIALFLARSETLGEVVPKLLQTICVQGNWDVGTFWSVDASGDALCCSATWHAPSLALGDFDAVSRELSCPPGVDLPGRVWLERRAVWISDVVTEPGFRRALMASKDALRTGFCFPIVSGGVFHGAVELFSREVRQIDAELVEAMTTLGASVGQFMKRREAEKALEHQALHDALTTLPNRMLFQRRLERALGVARSQDQDLAVLLLDLDRFKEVNDTFGHHYGDLLLQQAARRLESALRESDTIARLGGDEFAALLPGADRAEAMLVANRVLHILTRPFVIEKERLDVGASIGIALHPDHGENPAALLQHADIAMYAAKRGRRGLTVYTVEEDEHTPSRFALGVALRQAIEEGGLLLHYQPKMDFKTGLVDTVEALVRWTHPAHGLLPPDEFVPLAEELGLIKALTRWVMGEALHQCAWWRETGIELRVAVNVSSQMLHDPELVGMVVDLLERTRVDPRWLAIEITESGIMGDYDRALNTLSRLHDMGVRIAIDDFGTGYSSLAHLRRLRVDEIKIDKSFVTGVLHNDDDAIITQSVIDLGHNLGLEVVAEGIEDEATWEKIVTMGCDQVQGFYLSHPIQASELTSWLTGTSRTRTRAGRVRLLPHPKQDCG